MGNSRLLASSLFALSMLVACGDDGGSPIIVDSGIADAPPVDSAPPIDQPPPITYDFSCSTNTTPPTPTATITVTGTVNDIGLSGLAPLAGATVKACKGDCLDANLIATATPNPTTSNGAFSTGAMTTNGTAIDGYVLIAAPNHWPTRIYPFAPLTADLADVPTAMLTDALLGQLSTFLGITQEPGNGVVVVLATDCATAGVGDADVSVNMGATSVGDAPLDLGAFQAQFAGVYLITNVPPGDYTVKVSYAGTTTTNFLDNTVSVVANGLTGAQMRPGY